MVALRMPVNEQSTVEEVEKYFVSFAQAFKNQIKVKKANLHERTTEER